MRGLAADQNNDLFIDPAGNLAMVFDRDAVMQTCEHVMQTLKGEMVFSIDRGLPYRETVWGQNPNIPAFQNAARKALTQIPGVLSVPSMQARAKSGPLTYAAVIKTRYGAGEIGGGIHGQ